MPEDLSSKNLYEFVQTMDYDSRFTKKLEQYDAPPRLSSLLCSEFLEKYFEQAGCDESTQWSIKSLNA